MLSRLFVNISRVLTHTRWCDYLQTRMSVRLILIVAMSTQRAAMSLVATRVRVRMDLLETDFTVEVSLAA